VEKPGEGSLTRYAGPFPGDVVDTERSALFLHLNTNKRSIEVDLASDEGRAQILALAATSDVLIESFRPGVMESFGLGWEELRAVNPRLIFTRISNFGQTGPNAHLEASALTLQAAGGPMHATGSADRRPHQKPGYLPLYVIGRTAAEAALGALFHVRRRGEGSQLDISAHEVLLFSGDRRAAYLQNASYSGRNAPRGIRSAHRGTVLPTGPYVCKGGFVMLYVAVHFMPRMVELLGDADLIEFFADNERVVANPDEAWDRFNAVLHPWLARYTKEEIMLMAQKAHLPITAITSVQEMLEAPHYRERGIFESIDHAKAGNLEYPGRPFTLTRGGFGLNSPAPLLGEHTSVILAGVNS
jgi:CoA:oxalate CoA-transferase